MSVKLVWVTPDAEQMISDMARVSNPANQGLPPGKLLQYCVKNQHWSIFEMANAVFEIETTRDIARQILRHRSFSFQEFSQRYASVDVLPEAPLREARLQDQKNRQSSIPVLSEDLRKSQWEAIQQEVLDLAIDAYQEALTMGIAKEVARAVLPEGLTTSRMYMNGTIRSWITYCSLRSGNGTQREHAVIAQQISSELEKILPLTWKAVLDVK